MQVSSGVSPSGDIFSNSLVRGSTICWGSFSSKPTNSRKIMKKEKIYGLTLIFPTGYTGEGGNFGWIIPTPVPPAIEDVSEAGENGETAFEILDEQSAPVFSTGGGGCFPSGTEVLTASGPRNKGLCVRSGYRRMDLKEGSQTAPAPVRGRHDRHSDESYHDPSDGEPSILRSARRPTCHPASTARHPERGTDND